ncbi:MAG: D-alanyl-D-alanine carboxypeptidase [Candidatus Andersenbacteria bacterium]|nr:D-alanyl-D-alanine carboxypeptidase [Candidatus Andersenbacteria bacterium]
MHKSTPILIAVCILLLGGTAAVTWKAWHYEPLSIPLAGGSSVDIGLNLSDKHKPEKQFDAASAVLLDTTDTHILFQQNAFERRPIASISKLMTAMVALDYGIPWDKEADIQLEEYTQGGRLLLFNGEKVTMRDLFNASLLGSANNATLAYVRQLGMPKQEFIQAMNRKAVELGLEQTEFFDVTGLNPKNVSTAYEVAVLAKTAFEKYPDIAKATSQKEYAFTVATSGRAHTIRNTNKLVSELGDATGGTKTGYLYEANYCLVMAGEGELASRIGVILGSPSENGNFGDMRRLLHLKMQ